MIAIIDYGMGNLRSVQKALEKVGGKTLITQNPEDIRSAQKVVLPGVGAMKPAMDKLSDLNLTDPIKEFAGGGKPFLGICLGLQLLFTQSEESGGVQGLGIFPGKVARFSKMKVPHMGWNQINMIQKQNPLFKKIADGENMYFCHSYYVQPEHHIIMATETDYGIKFCSSIWKDNCFALQFHPEKSQESGLTILKNFVEL